MKTFIVLLAFLFLSHQAYSQRTYITKIETVPFHPTVDDEIKLITWISINSGNAHRISNSISINNDSIIVDNCFYAAITITQPLTSFHDTFHLGFLNQGNYTIRVSANSTNNLDDSCTILNDSIVSFYVGEATSVLTSGHDISLKVFPNPVNQTQQLKLTNQKADDLTVELFDLQGRLVKTVYKGKSLAGENIFSVDFSTLAAGVYYYRIMLGDKYYFQKAVKDQAP